MPITDSRRGIVARFVQEKHMLGAEALRGET
jgi:hypothetical protein